MKRLIFIILIFATLFAKAQTGETKPGTSKNVSITPYNASFHFNPPDTTLRISMGTYGILELISAKKVKFKVDSLAVKKQNKVTLTTTGTSGAATFNQGTGALNIPQYSGGGSSALTNNHIYVGNSSNIATDVTMSGDATIVSNTGTVAVNKTRLNVRNETGVTIASTKAVYVSGFNNVPLISLATNQTELYHNVVGITIAPISHEANGFIATTGQCDAETNGWTVGTELYLSSSGNLTSTAPTTGSVRHVAIVTVQANYPTGKLLIYNYPEENYFAGGSGTDLINRIGDNGGTNKASFRNYSNTEVASISSLGNISANKYTSTVATGTQPYAATSTTLNSNLNADLLDGYHATSFLQSGDLIPYRLKSDTVTLSGTASNYDLTFKKAINWFPTWSEVTDKPTLFSGSYTDLTNKPTIPSSLWSLSGIDRTGWVTDKVVKFNSSGDLVVGTDNVGTGGGIALTDLSATSPISYSNTTGVFSMVSDAYAPYYSGGYIQNQNASAQTANMWIDGSGTFGNTEVKWNKSGGDAESNFTNTFTSFLPVRSFLFSQTGVGDVFTIYSDGSVKATTAKLTNLTDGYFPYHISDAAGLGNSPVFTDGIRVAIGTTTLTGGNYLIDLGGAGTQYIGQRFLNTGGDFQLGIASSAPNGFWSGSTAYAGSLGTNNATDFQIATNGVVRQTIAANGAVTFASTVQATNYTSTVATGTQPYAATSTTLNTNLNADLLDGYHASSFLQSGDLTSYRLKSDTTALSGTASVYDLTFKLNYRTFGTAADNNYGDFAPAAHVGATGSAHGNATGSVAGFMTSADYTKLLGIASGATNFTNSNETDPTIYSWAKASTKPSYTYTEVGAAPSSTVSYTDALARSAISLTTNGSSGAATYSNTTGVLNIPQYSGGGMTYPSGSGIAIVTAGSSWGTTITDNSSNWNAAYGWGNHSGLYKTVSDSTATTGFTRRDRLASQIATREPKITKGTTAQYFRGDMSLATFPTISGSNTGDQTLTIGGTTSPTIALSVSNTATFSSGTGITLGQTGGTITVTNSAPMTYPNTLAGFALYNGSGGWSTTVYNVEFAVTSGENYKMPTSGAVYSFVNTNYSPTTHNHSGTYVPIADYGKVKLETSGAYVYLNDNDYSVSYGVATSNKALLAGSLSQAFNASQLTVESGTNDWTIAGSSDNLTFSGYATSVLFSSSAGVTASNFTLSSDRRLKRNIKPICFSNANQIKFVQYDLKADSTHRTKYGVIAQDVEKIMPELIYTDEKGMKSVDHTSLLIAKIAELENRIKALENENEK